MKFLETFYGITENDEMLMEVEECAKIQNTVTCNTYMYQKMGTNENKMANKYF